MFRQMDQMGHRNTKTKLPDLKWQKIKKIPKNGQNYPKMAKNDPNGPKMTQNGQKLSKMG